MPRHVLAAAIAFVCVASAEAQRWPTISHDPQHTGRTAAINRGPQLKWKVPMKVGACVQYAPYPAPLVANDGTIYVAAADGITALRPDGSTLWHRSTAFSCASPSLGADGTIYTNAGPLIAITPAGSEKWRTTSGLSGAGGSTIGSDGTIYYGVATCQTTPFCPEVRATTPSGAERWHAAIAEPIYASPAIAPDGTVYVTGWGKTLYAYTPAGALKWTFTTDYSWPYIPISVGNDGTVYIADLIKVYALTPAGQVKWRHDLDSNGPSALALAADGTIIVGNSGKYQQSGYVIAITPSGQRKWTFNTRDWMQSAPAIDGSGAIYIGSDDGHVYALNPNGTQKWAFDAGKSVESAITIGADGTLYFYSVDGWLYALNGAATQCSINCGTPTVPPRAEVSQAVLFSGSVTVNSCTGSPTYSWSFGDNQQNGVGATVKHTYANAGTYNWTMTATVDGQTCTKGGTITVTGPTCRPAVQSTSSSFSSAGGSSSTYVLGDAACSWSATSSAAWITLANPSSGAGSRLLRFNVAANTTNSRRSGTIRINDHDAITIAQRENGPSPSAPIVFVHGWCGDTTAWAAMIRNLQRGGGGIDATYYGSNSVELYYDGAIVRDRVTNTDVIADSRLYSMEYYAPGAQSFDSQWTKDIRVEQLAYQLQRIIEAVRFATNASVVDIVAHSLGGLITRALVEDLAFSDEPAQTLPYDGSSVRRIVTLDTPHAGAYGPSWDALGGVCFLAPGVQRQQMDPRSSTFDLLSRLNSKALPASLELIAVATKPVPNQMVCNPFCSPDSPHLGDQIVSYQSQDLMSQSLYRCASNVRTIPYVINRDTNPYPYGALHIYMHDFLDTAKIVNAALTATTSRTGCVTIAPDAPLTLPVGQVAGRKHATVRATFDATGPASVAGDACTAEVSLVARGIVVARTTIPAFETQSADLGVADVTNARVEMRPSCRVRATATLELTTAANGKRRAVQPRGGGTGANCSTIVPNLSLSITLQGSGNGCNTFDNNCTVGQAITFDILEFNYSLGCATHTFLWNFGDGSATTTSKNPTHVYPALGRYEVTSLINNGSQSVLLRQIVDVGGPIP